MRTASIPLFLLLVLPWSPAILAAGSQEGGQASPSTGAELYRETCLACHGADGSGMPQTVVGFETELPDFTDCSFASREPNGDWATVVHSGGPARAFSEIMPAFGEALRMEQIELIVDYLRTFCPDPAWPRGEFNLPRPLVTEKAFPEDEAVLTTTFATEGPSAFGHEIVYEKRFGARNHIETIVPFSFERQSGAEWAGGLGDIAVGYKRVLFHSLKQGSIFSLAGEIILPTGDKERGAGKGVTIFEPFVAFGQILPHDSFVQFQGGAELPTHEDDASKEVFWRTAVGKTISQQKGLGRAWTPMIEVLAAREMESGASTDWDLLPQLQVTLSKRQHIMANFGVRFPVTNAGPRATEFIFYVLWDWFDGGFLEGWK